MSKKRACQGYCDTCMNGTLPDNNYPCDECEESYNLLAADTPKHYRPNKPTLGLKSPIKDSGDRTEFTTGAVRDMHEGKGDMVSIPWEAILRLSKHYEAGAKKYTRFNYRKGINLSSYIDSACRHLAKYQCGCDDEDHLSAAAFNILGAMLVEEIQPELMDLPMREGKRRYRYFE